MQRSSLDPRSRPRLASAAFRRSRPSAALRLGLLAMLLFAAGCSSGASASDGPPVPEPEQDAAPDAVPPDAVPPDAVPPDAVPPDAVPPDAVPPDSCGDGVVGQDETCDGNCPTSCDDGDPCTVDILSGSAATCDVVCAHVAAACGHTDQCCPSGCTSASDADCPDPALCGNGNLDPNETCDGDCLSTCDDGLACTSDSLLGSAAECSARCQFVEIATCIDGDGCCPAACTAASDDDCSPTCGDGVVDPNETCDGDCPVSCDDADECTTDTMSGSAASCSAVCNYEAVSTCALDSDGCCPAGCDANNDADCSTTCGNGVVEPGETCDSNCPTACADGDACTADTLIGSSSACSAACTHQAINACKPAADGCCVPGCNANNDADCAPVCGNGVKEAGESCDGSCPTAAICNDSNACTIDGVAGTGCAVVCTYQAIGACQSGDGCCPAACNAGNDADCQPSCGNGVVEGGELCDGNCPTSAQCADADVCTSDKLTGSAATCDAACVHQPIVACSKPPDGCCPTGCNANTDGDCAPACGNGVVEPGETCDGACSASCNDNVACTTDITTGSAAGCDLVCSHQPIVECKPGSDGCCPAGCNGSNDGDCPSQCGNGIVEPGESCDGNCGSLVCQDDGDFCTVERIVGKASECNVTCAHEPSIGMFRADVVDQPLPTETRDMGRANSVFVDSASVAHVSYLDEFIQGTVTYFTVKHRRQGLQPGSWVQELSGVSYSSLLDDFDSNTLRTQMGVAVDGTSYILQGFTNGAKKHLKLNANEDVPKASTSTYQVRTGAMYIKDNKPHFVFVVEESGKTYVAYSVRTGPNVFSTPEKVRDGTAEQTSLVVMPGGERRVLIYDGTRLNYMTSSTVGVWTQQQVTTVSGNGAGASQLVVDGTGATLAGFGGSAWINGAGNANFGLLPAGSSTWTFGDPDGGGGYVWYPALGVDGQDRANLFWRTNTGNGYAVRTNGTWAHATYSDDVNGSFATKQVTQYAMATAPQGSVHLTYTLNGRLYHAVQCGW